MRNCLLGEVKKNQKNQGIILNQDENSNTAQEVYKKLIKKTMNYCISLDVSVDKWNVY